MVTGVIKNKVDKIWTDIWAGGLTNPLSVIEQLTYLMFIRSLDEKELETERNMLIDLRETNDKLKKENENFEAESKAMGAEISVARFTRYGLGDGIEKKEEDFAEEVRKQAGL